MLEIDTEDCTFQIEFERVQINLTNSCNLHCKHCRCGSSSCLHLGIEEVGKILDFVSLHRNQTTQITLSGGEPIETPHFFDVISLLCAKNFKRVSITTNGSTVTDGVLEAIRAAGFEKIIFSVSLDSATPAIHDELRGVAGAFRVATRAIEKLNSSGIDNLAVSIRSVILPNTLAEMKSIANLAVSLKCKSLVYSMVFPVGVAKYNNLVLPTTHDLNAFNSKLKLLIDEFDDLINISTNEPTFNVLKTIRSKEGEYAGCAAGTSILCVTESGQLKPCPMIDIPILSIANKTVSEIEKEYTKSNIIKKLLSRQLNGKCNTCKLKFSCGGCRARALNHYYDLFAEDPNCSFCVETL